MRQSRSRFCFLFLFSYPNDKYKNWSADVVLGIRTRGRRMVGSDDSTQLWRPSTIGDHLIREHSPYGKYDWTTPVWLVMSQKLQYKPKDQVLLFGRFQSNWSLPYYSNISLKLVFCVFTDALDALVWMPLFQFFVLGRLFSLRALASFPMDWL